MTSYDVYGQSLALDGANKNAIESLAKIYSEARSAANRVGTAFIPAVSPGFNDKAVRKGHPPRARYFKDDPSSKEGDIFREMLRHVALPYVDPGADRIIMITSFNEWFEDTQIEATKGTAGITSQDDSVSGDYYTEGDDYNDYGYLYLDILAEETEW